MAKRNALRNLLPEKLNDLARDHVGDCKGVNVYFVTDEAGDVVTVSYSYAVARDAYNALARSTARECTLEDRYYGVIASCESLVEGQPRCRVEYAGDDAPKYRRQS